MLSINRPYNSRSGVGEIKTREEKGDDADVVTSSGRPGVSKILEW
jgi:hypothetical protein